MDEYKFNRVNELLGESVIYEAKKKTKIKLSLDDGSKKEMDFDGSLNDAKKKYSGKKVKTIRKSKSGDIIGEAVIVNVEELDEAANSGKKLIKITYEIWDEDSLEAGETDDKGWEDEEGEEFESDEDGTAAEKAIKFLKKKDATNASDGSYQSGTWYQDDGDTDMKTGDKKYLAYHLHGSWTPEEKKEIYKGVTNKKINESTESEKVTFEKPLDIFKWIKDNSQAIYVKQNKDGKYEGSSNPKTKKGSILVDGVTANWGIQIYNKVNDDSRKILDKASLERFLNIIISRTTKKVNESEETKFKVNKSLIVSESLPQYLETMLWSSTDIDSEEPLDKEYDVKDISKELKDSSKKDLLSFAEYCEKNCSKELEDYLEEEGYSSFGHDMWLSRNGHGTGFFDRGNGYNALQKASKTFGSVDPTVNKGKIVA